MGNTNTKKTKKSGITYGKAFLLLVCLILLAVGIYILVSILTTGKVFGYSGSGNSNSSNGSTGGGGNSTVKAPKPDIAIQLNDDEDMELYITYVRGIFDIEIEIKKDKKNFKTDSFRAEFGTFSYRSISNITAEGEYTLRARVIPINNAKLASPWSSEVELQIKTETINNAGYNWDFVPVTGLLYWNAIGSAAEYRITANGTDISHLVQQESNRFYADVGGYFASDKLAVVIESHGGTVTSVNASGSFASIITTINKSSVTFEKKTTYLTDADYNWEFIPVIDRLYWDGLDSADVFRLTANGDNISNLIYVSSGRFYADIPAKYFDKAEIIIESFKDVIVTFNPAGDYAFITEYINRAELTLEKQTTYLTADYNWEYEPVINRLYWDKTDNADTYKITINGDYISDLVCTETGRYYLDIPAEYTVGEFEFEIRIESYKDTEVTFNSAKNYADITEYINEAEVKFKKSIVIIEDVDYNLQYLPVEKRLYWDKIDNATVYTITINGDDVSALVRTEAGRYYVDIPAKYIGGLEVIIKSFKNATVTFNAAKNEADITEYINKGGVSYDKSTEYLTADYKWEFISYSKRLYWNKTDNAAYYKITANGEDISDLVREEAGRFYVDLPSKYFTAGNSELEITIESHKETVVIDTDVIEYINEAILVLEQAGTTSNVITVWELVGRSLYWKEVPGITNYGARANGIDISSNVHQEIISGVPTYFVVIPNEFWIPLTTITLLIYSYEDVISIHGANGIIERIIYKSSAYRRIDIHYFS